MDNLYQRIINVLDRSEHDPAWHALLTELGEPSSFHETERVTSYYHHRSYYFDNIGLSFIYLLNQKIFASVCFSFDTFGVKTGAIRPYQEPVHAGITSTDSRDEVELRMGTNPYYVSDPRIKKALLPRTEECCGEPSHIERYELPPYHFSYHFKSIDGGLSMMGIDLCKVRVKGSKEHHSNESTDT